MEENMIPKAPVAPRRRKRKTKMQIIKEAYLPYIFLMAAALLILIFIIGALIRGATPEEAPEEPEDPAEFTLTDEDYNYLPPTYW